MKTSALLFAFTAFLALWLSSCASTLPRLAPFSEAEFAAYRHAGSGTVAGQLTVTAPDKSVHVGIGNHVALFPVNAYTKEMVDREIGNGEYLQPSDPRFLTYVRTTVTDPRGNFSFSRIPAGEYYVLGLAQWNAANGAQYQWACETVRVGGGQTVSVKLSHDLHRPQRPTVVAWPLW